MSNLDSNRKVIILLLLVGTALVLIRGFGIEAALFWLSFATGMTLLWQKLCWWPAGNTEYSKAGTWSVWLEYSRAIFPIVLIVLIIRSFVFEPFRIPSGSMMPTLLRGDFIIVKKFAYAWYVPVLRYKLAQLDQPKRGDIIVFRYPPNPKLDYIKRVVGLPGDHISYRGKQIFINNQPISRARVGGFQSSKTNGSDIGLYSEALGAGQHQMLLEDNALARDVDVVVPDGEYFVMGDNRDNSNDSRYWGTVPAQNILGKAVLIWMSWDLDKGGVVVNRIGRLLQ